MDPNALPVIGVFVMVAGVASLVGVLWDRRKDRRRMQLLHQRPGTEDRARRRGRFYIHDQDSSNA